jgi:hypothetical protein
MVTEVRISGSSRLLGKVHFNFVNKIHWDVHLPGTGILITRVVVMSLGFSCTQQNVFDRFLTYIDGREHEIHRLSKSEEC